MGGWQPSMKTKNGINLLRSLDKEKDTYTEIVTDYKTGKVIYKNKNGEKLSEHTGYGSAKNEPRQVSE